MVAARGARKVSESRPFALRHELQATNGWARVGIGLQIFAFREK